MNRDQVERLKLIFSSSSPEKDIVHLLLGEAEDIRSSQLASRMAELIAWNHELFPAFDFQCGSKRTSHSYGGQKSIYLMSHSKDALLLEDHVQTGPLPEVYIVNCSDTSIYIASQVRNVSVFGCSDVEIILMAVSGSVAVSFSDHVTLRCVCSYIRLDNSIDCKAFVYATKGATLTGDTRGIELGPFNVCYSRHRVLLATCGGLLSDLTYATLWSQPICATLSEAPYVIHNPSAFHLVRFPEFAPQQEQKLLVCLPQVYEEAVKEKLAIIQTLKNEIGSIRDESDIQKVNSILSGHFREWISSHKLRCIVDILRSRMLGTNL